MTSKINQPTLHHVNLKTTRLQEMIDWYGTVVGSKPNFQFPGGAWLTNDGANHRIALLTSSKMSDDPDKLVHTGMHHLAFEYGNFNDLLDTYSRLRELDIKPHMSLDHGITTSFYYVDPDGNSVELQYDNFDDWNKSSEWMRTSKNLRAIRSACRSIRRRWLWPATAGRPVTTCIAGPSPANFCRPSPSIHVCRWIDDGRTALSIVVVG